jgi:hypothetical protein
MNYQQQTPRKRPLRAFRKVKTIKRRSPDMSSLLSLQRDDVPKEKETTTSPDLISISVEERRIDLPRRPSPFWRLRIQGLDSAI